MIKESILSSLIKFNDFIINIPDKNNDIFQINLSSIHKNNITKCLSQLWIIFKTISGLKKRNKECYQYGKELVKFIGFLQTTSLNLHSTNNILAFSNSINNFIDLFSNYTKQFSSIGEHMDGHVKLRLLVQELDALVNNINNINNMKVENGASIDISNIVFTKILNETETNTEIIEQEQQTTSANKCNVETDDTFSFCCCCNLLCDICAMCGDDD